MAAPLFCKPHPGMRPSEILFLLTDQDLGGTLAFRSLDLEGDMDMIHDWVNQPYSRRYWQMYGDRGWLLEHYQELLENPNAHSFIGLFQNNPVCQLDCYLVAADELVNHVPAGPGCCGFHILMLPPRQSKKGLTEAVLKAFTRFFFSFSEARVLYGEPDHRNSPANLAAKRAGFELMRPIELSTKTANLYRITRSQFFSNP